MTQTQPIKKFLEQAYREQLTDEEVLEYKDRLVKFFALLVEIDQKNNKKMTVKISEVQIVPIKPKDGLMGFASFVLDDRLYLGSIGIMTQPEGGYRLTYPTKAIGIKSLNVFYPINKNFAQEIEKIIINRFEEVMEKVNNNDRYNRTNG